MGYIYTDDAGWIDLPHSMEAARWSSIAPDALVILGDWEIEANQWFGGKSNPKQKGVGSSAWSPEDLRSNAQRAEFGDGLDDEVPLSEQLQAYFTKLGARDPTDAPDWDELPATEQEHEQNWRDECEKRQQEFDKRMERVNEGPVRFHWEHRPPGGWGAG